MTPPASRMLRLAVTPRWLVAVLVMLVFVAAAILLGRWQWDRTQTILEAERAAASQPVAIETVVTDQDESLPDEGIGRPVTVTGRYDPALQVAVTSRELDGRPGVWIVSGVRLEDGRVVAVQRGWLPSMDDPGAAVPEGTVTVTGVLQPDEGFYADADSAPGTVASIASGRLAELWQEQVLPGFVALKAEEPSTDPSPLPVPPTVQTADVPFPLQNFFYAFQWWVFAAFGIALYLRWLWIEAAPEAADDTSADR